jgi:hypothetical protein
VGGAGVPGVPFDSRHSWLAGDATRPARALAIIASAAFLLAGILVLAGSNLGAPLAVTGAAVSLLLALLTFNRWLVFAIAIDLAIVAIALS